MAAASHLCLVDLYRYGDIINFTGRFVCEFTVCSLAHFASIKFCKIIVFLITRKSF